MPCQCPCSKSVLSKTMTQPSSAVQRDPAVFLLILVLSVLSSNHVSCHVTMLHPRVCLDTCPQLVVV